MRPRQPLPSEEHARRISNVMVGLVRSALRAGVPLSVVCADVALHFPGEPIFEKLLAEFAERYESEFPFSFRDNPQA